MAFSELFKIVGVSLVTLVCYVIIKPLKPDIAVFVSLAGSCLILVFCIDYLTNIVSGITIIFNEAKINSGLFSIILKIIGIGYLIEFASSTCMDAGANSLADKVAFAGKVCILGLSLPIITNLLNLIIEIVP